MFLNTNNSCAQSSEQLRATQDRTRVERFRSTLGRGVALLLIVAVCVVTAGAAATGKKKRKPYTPPTVDAKALTTMLQHFDKVEKEEHPWGWIRWLMNSKLDSRSRMTFGIVEINSGQTNPLHVHPNCEEVIYVLSGSCEHRIGTETVTLKVGDALRIPRGVPHTAKTSKDEGMRAVIAYNSGDRQFEVVEE